MFKKKNILIISDDLNLPLGKIRFRSKGTSGGHNGLENIEQALNSLEYPRLRIGIGNDKNSNQINFVLGIFNSDEYDIIHSNFDLISSAITNAIMNLSITYKKPIGNGIITCFNDDQARQRKNKGAEAAAA